MLDRQENPLMGRMMEFWGAGSILGSAGIGTRIKTGFDDVKMRKMHDFTREKNEKEQEFGKEGPERKGIKSAFQKRRVHSGDTFETKIEDDTIV